MSKINKIFKKIINGTSDKNINFNDLLYLLTGFGFSKRIKGDHFIFYKNGIREIINIQPIGNLAKPYQIKQVREIIIKYKLGEIINE
jgi:hypothetical protein